MARARVRRFPCGVCYRDMGETVIVVRVLHKARDAVQHLR